MPQELPLFVTLPWQGPALPFQPLPGQPFTTRSLHQPPTHLPHGPFYCIPHPTAANVWTWSHRGFFIWFKVVFSVVFLFSSD